MQVTNQVFIGRVYLTSNQEQTFFFFDSFGLDGVKNFIIEDEMSIVNKILLGVEQINRSDNKITLYKIQSWSLQRPDERRNRISQRYCTELFSFYSGFWNKIKAEKLCKHLDGRGQNTRLRL